MNCLWNFDSPCLTALRKCYAIFPVMSESASSLHLHQHNVVTSVSNFANLISTEWYFMIVLVWILILWVKFCLFHICLYVYLNFLFHVLSVHSFSYFSIVLFLFSYWFIGTCWKRGGFPFFMLYTLEWKDISKCTSCPLSDPSPSPTSTVEK